MTVQSARIDDDEKEWAKDRVLLRAKVSKEVCKMLSNDRVGAGEKKAANTAMKSIGRPSTRGSLQSCVRIVSLWQNIARGPRNRA